MTRLHGRVCVVTGASGIAAAAAQTFIAAGARVFTISLDRDECAALHDDLAGDGAQHGWIAADLTDEGATEAAFLACIDKFGTIDGLFAVAGGSGRRFGDGPAGTISLDGWQATLDLNLTTSFLSMREAIRHMQRRDPSGGSIVITSSVLADNPSPHRFDTHAYATAKGAQLAMVRAAAAHYADLGIRINAIQPGLTSTPMSARAGDDEATMKYVLAKQPLAGGMIPAGDVADAARFLLSDEARYITGQMLAVDGGWTLAEAGS